MLHTDDEDDLVVDSRQAANPTSSIIIDSGLLAVDPIQPEILEFAAVWGPLSIQSEAYLSGVVRQTPEPPPQFSGAYAYVSYFLTTKPALRRSLVSTGLKQFARKSHEGTLSLGKLEQDLVLGSQGASFNLDLEDVNRGKYNDLTVGFNWYWSDRTRWMFLDAD